MVQIAGNYQLVKNENLFEQLVALDIPEDKARLIDLSKTILEVKVDGKKITLTSESGSLKNTNTLVLDEEVDENVPLGYSVKSTAKLSGDTLTISSKAETEAKSGDRIFKFSDTEVVVSSISEDSQIPTSRCFFKRI